MEGSNWCFPRRQRSKSLPYAPDGPRAKGIYAGYPLGRDYAGLDDALLVAVTEKRTTEEIDRLAEALSVEGQP